MRPALIALATIAAMIAADVQAANAQNESFFQDRYCARRGGVPSRLNCAYKTLEQCNMIFEPGRYCLENPWWHGSREQPTTQRKGRRNSNASS
jgi:uncharacterized protein DUF3551